MPELVRAVADHGYTSPTPVQVQAIPVILEGRDVLAGAQTGTGKTAGFTLPLLQRLVSRANASPSPARHPIRALVLTPTRELAAQVEQSIRTYGKHLHLKTTLVYGGVGINPQIDALRRGVDILVATPGRLLDHAGQKTVDLRHVEILVLDEADRMLDMGFIRDIRRILALLPAKRQNLLFSATFSDEIRSLASGLLHDPAMVQVARRNAESELVAQRVYPVPQTHKRALLAHLVSSGDWRQVLVFTRTKHGANRLAEQLCKDGIEATAIHGNKSQGARTKALAGFKAGDVRVLVATDLASRGLDIVELPHVVNYEMPHVPEDYVHRIGRTGRAGSVGEAISLVAPDEAPLLADIEKLLKRKLERTPAPAFEPRVATPVEPRLQAQARSRTGTPSRHQQARDADAQPRRRAARDPDAQPRHHPTRDPDAQPRHEAAHEANAQPRRQATRDPDAQPRYQPARDPDAQPRHHAAHDPDAQPRHQPARDPDAQPRHAAAHEANAQPRRQATRDSDAQPRYQPARDPDAQPRHHAAHDPDAQPRHEAAHEANAQPRRQPPREAHARKQHQPAHAPARDHQEPVQPASHESALGRLHDHARRAPRSGGRRDKPIPALLRGTPRRTN
jgi:ATP-dependent RNA helicase RhlE